MQSGIYILLLSGAAGEISVGALGPRQFATGYYAYAGSALGPGGLSRVSRHIRLSRNKDRPPRWHIDYLLSDTRFRLIRVYCGYTTERLECQLANALTLPAVTGFGSSDCTCPGHLFFSPDEPHDQVIRAFRVIGLSPVMHHLTPAPAIPGHPSGNV